MAAHIFISGFVQGVGFRAFIQRSAQDLRLTGWVKNLSDNRVEALFQGSTLNIERMVLLCKRGPFLSEVKDVVVEWSDSKEDFKTFEVLR